MPGEKAPNREGNQFGSFLPTIWEYHWVIIIIMIIMALVVMIGWYTFDYMPSPSLQISSAEELNRLCRRSPEPLFPPKSVIQTERTGSMHVDRRSRLRYQSLSYEVNCTSTLADGMLEIYEYDLNCVYWPGTTHIKNPYIDQPIPSRGDLSVATTISLSPPYIYPDPSLPEGTV
jgi:hypothetical protein